ncbi:MAG: hypothetical protein ACR2QO_16550 [Acidimicrobiales bacterium]
MTSIARLAVAAVTLFAVSCTGGVDEPSVAPDNTDTAVTTSSSSSTSTPVAAPADPVVSVAELRRALGASSVVARTAGVVVASSELGEVELPDDYPGVYRDHLLVDGEIVDNAGRPVCEGFEILGDFHVVTGIESVDGRAIVTVEDRRLLVFEGGEFESIGIPRWNYDCESDEWTELAPQSNVERRDEATIQTTTTSAGSILIAERGLGDTPLRLTTHEGTVVIDTTAIAYDYVLSVDAKTVYFVTYSGTGAASPPVGVVAVDVATGAERWRLGEGGSVWLHGDRLVIHVVDPTIPPELGVFIGREIVFIDPETGDELDRFPFEGRLLGLF